MKKILSHLAPVLRSKGYKGSGQNYQRISEDMIAVVNFQRSSGGQQFYVNLGVHPLFLPDFSGSLPDPKKIKEYDCMLRKRIDPPEGLSGWPYDLESDMLDDLEGALANAEVSYLTPLTQSPSPITTLTAEEFATLSPDSIFGGTTAAHCLNFERVAAALGLNKRAQDFAKLGLERCPERATSLRANLHQMTSL